MSEHTLFPIDNNGPLKSGRHVITTNDHTFLSSFGHHSMNCAYNPFCTCTSTVYGPCQFRTFSSIPPPPSIPPKNLGAGSLRVSRILGTSNKDPSSILGNFLQQMKHDRRCIIQGMERVVFARQTDDPDIRATIGTITLKALQSIASILS